MRIKGREAEGQERGERGKEGTREGGREEDREEEREGGRRWEGGREGGGGGLKGIGRKCTLCSNGFQMNFSQEFMQCYFTRKPYCIWTLSSG